MNFADKQLDRLVDEVAKASKEDGTLYVHRKVVVEAVEKRLKDEGLPTEARHEFLRRIAEAETDRYFNRRKPKPSAQQSFYHPEMWLPLGDGKRVQLSDAGTADLITYRRIIEKNRERVNRAADMTVEYVDSRIEALNANPGHRLDWIERNVFGWTSTEFEVDDPSDEQDAA